MKRMYRFIATALTSISLLNMTNFTTLAYSGTKVDGLSDADKMALIQKGDFKYDESNGAYIFTLEEPTKQLTSSNDVETMKKTTYSLVPITDEAKASLPEYINELRGSGGSSTKDGSDSAGTVDAYVTVYYDEQSIGDKSYIHLTKISGGYSADGSGSVISGGITVSDHNVFYGQTGFTTAESFKEQKKNYNIGKTNRSFSVTPPTSWLPVAEEDGFCTVGADYTITLKRGSGTWECDISNNIYGGE